MLRLRSLLLALAAVGGTFWLAAPAGIGAQATNSAQLVGTPRADQLIGTPNADMIRGLAGDDELVGGPGADQLYGGPGDDRIDGRDADTHPPPPKTRAPFCLQASKPAPCVPLPTSADVISAGPGNDIIETRDGHPDAILCGPGQDVVIADPTDLFSASNPRSNCETVELPTARQP